MGKPHIPGHACLRCSPQCFSVHSLGWVAVAEEELALGRSGVTVNNCIRQLAGQEPALVEVSGWWGGQPDSVCVCGGGLWERALGALEGLRKGPWQPSPLPCRVKPCCWSWRRSC